MSQETLIECNKVRKLYFKWLWQTLSKAGTRSVGLFWVAHPQVSMSCQVAIVRPYQTHISRPSGTQDLSRFLTGDNTRIQTATPPRVVT